MSKTDNEKKGPGFTEKFSRYFREMRGELKKVVWPSRKQVLNHTGVVLVMVAVSGLVIGGFDAVLSVIVKTLFQV